MHKKGVITIIAIIIHLGLHAQSVFDSIIIKHTQHLLPNEKVTYAFNYCEKNLSTQPNTIFNILSGIEIYLKEHPSIKSWDTYHYYLATFYYANENFDTALQYFNKALAAEQTLSKDKFILSLFYTSNILIAKGNLDQAKINTAKASQLIQSINNNYFVGLLYQNEANINVADDDFLTASNQFKKAISLFREVSDTLSIALIYDDFAKMYSKLGNELTAIDYFEKSENIYRKTSNKALLAKNQLNMGRSFLSALKFHDALTRLVSAEALYTQLDHRKKLAEVYCLTGQSYGYLHKYNEALLYLNKALALFIIENKPEEQSETLLLIGNVYTNLNHIYKAQQNYLKSLSIAQNPKTKLANYEKLSLTYSKLKNFQKAYEYQVLYSKLHYSIITKTTDSQLNKLNKQLENILSNNNSEKQIMQKELSILLESKKEKMLFVYLIILGLAAIVVILSILLLRFLNRSKNTINQFTEVIKAHEKKISKQKTNFERLKKSSEQIFSLTTKNMWEPFWVLERLSNQIVELKESNVVELESSRFDNDQLIMARNLMENVLFWTKNQQKLIEMQAQKISLSQLLNPIIKTQQIRASAKKISIQYKPLAAAQIYADKQTIQVALRNIIENAIKFSTINGEISITVKSDDGYIVIVIHDNGVGMTKDQINTLFAQKNPYYASGTHGEKGAGLGLRLSKEFIERNFGKLDIESSIAFGTKVSVFLPSNSKLI